MIKKKNRNVHYDIINRSCSRNFTQIPNDIIRNPELTSKAKTVLCILLSNREGWKSYIVSLCGMMKEGQTSIKNALKELEKFGFLIRIQYRRIDNGRMKGYVWFYTDQPYQFYNLKGFSKEFRKSGFELVLNGFLYKKPEAGKPEAGKPEAGFSAANNINNKNINNKNKPADDGIKIIYPKPKHFDKFWKMYPRKAQKGTAKISWNKMCRKKITSETPTIKQILKAIRKQRETKQWKKNKGKWIPYPSTWINNMRWLDEIEPMNESHNNIKEGVRRTDIERKAAKRDTIGI